jgi:hypothetical protein
MFAESALDEALDLSQRAQSVAVRIRKPEAGLAQLRPLSHYAKKARVRVSDYAGARASGRAMVLDVV